ncbi:MAG TPA: exo-beta-N-acetylmuramidase NamZ domain-containing protein [Terriglobales bacterium]|nr:exo-beta-N-acetylmuramidase NamZ domain-containing protein [Terriglobales bacterium]
MRTLLSLIFLSLSLPIAFAQQAPSKKIASKTAKHAPTKAAALRFKNLDTVIEDAIKEQDCPGAVVLVGHHGRVLYRKAYGMRSLEPTREKMTVDTIFDLASLTKVVATTPSILRMLELGQIRLNDPVAKYLPEFAQNGKEYVTIRELLTHYSGLPEDLDLKTEWFGKATAEQMAFAEKLVTPPGSVFRYSDINFETLGFLVEKISSMPLDKYASAFVFQPLGMKTTRFLPPPEWRHRIAPTEYDEHGEMLRGVVHDPTARRMGGVAGHAGLFSTADDLSKYAQALLDAIHGKPKRDFLKTLIVTKATRPEQPPDAVSLRGLGWDIDSPFSSNRGELFPIGSFGHTGFTGTSIWIDPFTDTYVILLTNAVHPHVGHSVVALRANVANVVATTLDIGKELHNKHPLLAITGYNEAEPGSRRMAYRNATVLNGIDVLEATNFAALKPTANDVPPRRIGLLTNQTGVDLNGRRTVDVLNSVPGIKLAALFSPEHGAVGELDTTQIGNTVDHATGIPVYSVYGSTDAQRHPQLDQLKQLDAVVIDLQDAGVRFYTYDTAMAYFLEAAGQTGTEIVVLDRPDPVGGAVVEGPIADPDRYNYVSYYSEPSRHGMTMGELARFFNGERHLGANLTVVPMQGWQRGDWFDSIGQVWINPSPNLRSLNEATLYPGVGLIEGTNISVGRGTDTPFELLGAPWIHARELSSYLNNRHISGVRFVPIAFTPTSSNYASQRCEGVNMIVMNRLILDSPELGIELASALHKLYPNDFQMEKMMTLVANQQTMDDLNAGVDPRFISMKWNEALEAWEPIRDKYLLYR